MKLTTVEFMPGGDGITALYVCGKLYNYGDNYHDKIHDWIAGFKAGLQYAIAEGFCETLSEETLLIERGKLSQKVAEGSLPAPDTLAELRRQAPNPKDC